ncbi:MAG: DUF4397 domain-containing protein [Phycisphaerales bacterium]
MIRSTRLMGGAAVGALCAATAAAATEPAEVRVIHASPDAPAVDVRVDGAIAFPNLSFTGVTDYAVLAPDTYDVDVVPSGASGPAVIDAALTLDEGTSYTVLAIDRLASIEPLVLVDDRATDPDAARVRFIHLSPDAPAVDIAVAGGPILVPGAEFRDASAFLTVAPGTYDLEVRLAGTSTVVLPLDDIRLTAGRVYTAAVVGLVSEDPGLSAILAVDAADQARVSVVHASPDAPNVDVLADGAVAFADIPFTGNAGPAMLPAGSTSVQVVPAGASEPVVIDATLELDPNVSYTVVATGELAEIAPLVLVNDPALDASAARVRFVHASPNAPAVDVALAGGDVLFPNATFRDASDYLAIAAGTYDLEVRLAGTSTVVLPLPGVTLESNTVLSVYAMGLVGAEPPLQAVITSEVRGEARVRAIHLSPDAPVVDVRVDGGVAIPDLAFGNVSGYAALPARLTNVQVVPAGAKAPAVIDADLELAPGLDYSVLAVDVLEQIAPLVLIDDNTVDAAVGRVRFVHGSPNAPAVDVALAGGDVLFGNFEFTDQSDYLPIPPGTYDLEVRLAGTNTVVLPLPGIVVRPNTVVTAYAAGLVGGQPALQAILSLDAEGCLGDVNADGTVDFFDLLHVLSDFGDSGTGTDLDGSGVTDFVDLLTVLSVSGDC